MFGALAVASTTFTSCKDYDDDIKDLQAQIDASGVNLSAEIQKLEGLLATNKTACDNAAAELAQAIKNATNDANGYAEIQAAEAKKAAVDASAALIEQAIENLKNGELQAAQSKADAAYTLAEQAKAAADAAAGVAGEADKLAKENKANLEKLSKGLGETNDQLEKALQQINKLTEDLKATNADLAGVKGELATTSKLVEDNIAKLTALTKLNITAIANDKRNIEGSMCSKRRTVRLHHHISITVVGCDKECTAVIHNRLIE